MSRQLTNTAQPINIALRRNSQSPRSAKSKDTVKQIGVTTRINNATSRTGRSAEEVEQLPFDLSALEEEGVFVNVDTHGFGMLNRRLDWQALGILLPAETDVAFHPPRCGIIPNRYRRPLMTPAAQAHAALHKYSYRFRLTETVFETPAYRWIPWRAFAEFERAFDAANHSLGDAKRAVLDDYEEIRREVLETFTQLATDSANRLLATGYVVPADFRERLTTSVLDALPSESELREGLTLKYQVSVILLGSEMLREQRRAVKERSKLEATKAQESHKRARQRVAEATIQQELWEQRESARLRLVAQEEEQMREAAVKERIRQLKVEAAREKLNETLSPLQEGAAQLRASVYESAVAIHEALTKNDFLPGATAKKARNMAHWFRLMNFQSDAELDRLIGELEGLASTAKKKRSADSTQVKHVLDDIIELCYRDAQSLAAPSRLAALEL